MRFTFPQAGLQDRWERVTRSSGSARRAGSSRAERVTIGARSRLPKDAGRAPPRAAPSLRGRPVGPRTGTDEGSHRDATLCRDSRRRWDLPGALSIPVGKGPWPAVIMFPDAGGMRDTMRSDGRAVIGSGLCGPRARLLLPQRPLRPVDMPHPRSPLRRPRRRSWHDAGLHRRPGGARRRASSTTLTHWAREEAGRRRHHRLLHGRSDFGSSPLRKPGRAHRCGSFLPRWELAKAATLTAPHKGESHQGRRVRGGGDRGTTRSPTSRKICWRRP